MPVVELAQLRRAHRVSRSRRNVGRHTELGAFDDSHVSDHECRVEMLDRLHPPPTALTTLSVVTRRSELRDAACPVGRGVDAVGDGWSILIVRDAMLGITRFDDFRRHLGISPTMLTERLRRLLDRGILRRRRYETRPPRDEYVLTDRGRQAAAVVLALAGWANDALEPDNRPVVVVDNETGEEIEAVLIDRRTGVPIQWPRHRFAPGPAADPRVRAAVDPDRVDRAAS